MLCSPDWIPELLLKLRHCFRLLSLYHLSDIWPKCILKLHFNSHKPVNGSLCLAFCDGLIYILMHYLDYYIFLINVTQEAIVECTDTSNVHKYVLNLIGSFKFNMCVSLWNTLLNSWQNFPLKWISKMIWTLKLKHWIAIRRYDRAQERI